MLARLVVRNLAVVESADVAFGPGLNVITGETGAGKSVLMGALHLLLGERADRTMIRTGAEEASVSAVYELEDTRAVDAILEEAEFPPCEGGTLILRRTVQSNGNGRIRVNDAPATSGLLRRLAPFLTDIHGPNDTLSLLDEAFQLRLLTAYADAGSECDAYARRWETRSQAQATLLALTGDPEARKREQERLAYELEELREVNPTEEDGDALVQRHAEAANFESILATGNALLDQLSEGEQAIAGQLIDAQHQLHTLDRLLPEAADWKEQLGDIQDRLEELGRSLANRLSRIEADPDALEALETRMGQIQRLKRLYGPTLDDVLRHRTTVEARLRELNDAEGDIVRARQAVAEAEAALLQAGHALQEKRRRALEPLAGAITAELRDLGFAQAAFSIDLQTVAPAASGIDRAVFMFAPNPGEAARPLAAIASSGEIARVMLAIKAILALHDAGPTLVFDEIDANIGGETGHRVGEKLRRLAGHSQILCITHQPQAAVFGQTHLCVTKTTEAGRTQTRIVPLDERQRVAEIARMLGGRGLTSVVEAHAAELLRNAATPIPAP